MTKNVLNLLRRVEDTPMRESLHNIESQPSPSPVLVNPLIMSLQIFINKLWINDKVMTRQKYLGRAVDVSRKENIP